MIDSLLQQAKDKKLFGCLQIDFEVREHLKNDFDIFFQFSETILLDVSKLEDICKNIPKMPTC